MLAPRAVTKRTEPEPRSLLGRGPLLALCTLIAAANGLLHYHLVDGPTHEGQFNAHLLLIHGRGPYPDQYRVLTPFLAEGLMLLGLSFVAAYQLLRFVFVAASLCVFHQYLLAWVRPALALAGLFALAAVLPFTYLFYTMQPGDPLNMLVFFLAFLALSRERDAWIVPLVIVGVLNRETAVLLPLLHALVRYRRDPRSRWIALCVTEAVLAAGIYAGLRAVIGSRAPYAPISPLHYWKANASDALALVQVLGFFNLALWLSWRDWRHKPAFLRRTAWMVPVFFVVYGSFGYLREIRYFLPVLPVVVPLALLTLQRRSDVAARV
jgi:hypothetical protein